MECITIPIVVTGSNGKKVTVPYAKVGLLDGKPDILMNDLLIAMIENLCAKQNDTYNMENWSPNQISLYANDPDNYVPYHRVSLETWAPANKEASEKLKRFVSSDGVFVE